jgi:biotin-(acetyl-CoA carboxylase) ligase
VSGSLVSTQLDGPKVISCVLGIGINLEQAPELGVDRRFGVATSLRSHGIIATIPHVFGQLLSSIKARLDQLGAPDGASALAADYRERMGGIGRMVEIHQETGDEILARGRLLNVHADLSLEIEGIGRIEKGRLRFVEVSQG